jgi:hypothetical protein
LHGSTRGPKHRLPFLSQLISCFLSSFKLPGGCGCEVNSIGQEQTPEVPLALHMRPWGVKLVRPNLLCSEELEIHESLVSHGAFADHLPLRFVKNRSIRGLRCCYVSERGGSGQTSSVSRMHFDNCMCQISTMNSRALLATTLPLRTRSYFFFEPAYSFIAQMVYFTKALSYFPCFAILQRDLIMVPSLSTPIQLVISNCICKLRHRCMNHPQNIWSLTNPIGSLETFGYLNLHLWSALFFDVESGYKQSC